MQRLRCKAFSFQRLSMFYSLSGLTGSPIVSSISPLGFLSRKFWSDTTLCPNSRSVSLRATQATLPPRRATCLLLVNVSGFSCFAVWRYPAAVCRSNLSDNLSPHRAFSCAPAPASIASIAPSAFPLATHAMSPITSMIPQSQFIISNHMQVWARACCFAGQLPEFRQRISAGKGGGDRKSTRLNSSHAT